PVRPPRVAGVFFRVLFTRSCPPVEPAPHPPRQIDDLALQDVAAPRTLWVDADPKNLCPGVSRSTRGRFQVDAAHPRGTAPGTRPAIRPREDNIGKVDAALATELFSGKSDLLHQRLPRVRVTPALGGVLHPTRIATMRITARLEHSRLFASTKVEANETRHP